MKKVLLTTAMGMMLALPLAAQTVPAATGTETAPQVFFDRVGAGVKASDLVGKRVYAAKTLTGTEAALEKPADDWEDVGEVRDLVIDPAGDIEAALVDVGGFLGIGEKTVAVNMEALHLVPDAATAGRFFVVMQGDRAALEAAPAYAAVEPGTTEARNAAGSLPVTDITALSADVLTGKPVYGIGDAKLGEVSDVVAGADGTTQKVIVDVGGVLGIGAKPVALSPAQIEVKPATDGGEMTLHVAATEEELTAMPEYKG